MLCEAFSFLPRAPVSGFRTESIPGQLLQKERAQPSDENKQKCHKVALSKTHQLEKFHSELSCPKEGGWAEICRPACPISSALTGKSPGGQLPYSGVGFFKELETLTSLLPICLYKEIIKRSRNVRRLECISRRSNLNSFKILQNKQQMAINYW